MSRGEDRRREKDQSARECREKVQDRVRESREKVQDRVREVSFIATRRRLKRGGGLRWRWGGGESGREGGEWAGGGRPTAASPGLSPTALSLSLSLGPPVTVGNA